MAELLSPAGDRDCLRAAVENGADAVYFGLDVGFNARARATNFSLGDLPEVVDYLHSRGAKAYVTLNTLVFSDEMPEAERHVRLLAQRGVDAVLVQDLGLARLIREVAPDLALHASTQMTLTSAECIAVARQLGITRVVLPRELSVAEIARLHQACSLELEAFVHGALCVAYSGQCLTSESLGGRSANRGQCAQACRLPYTIVCDDQDVDLADQRYLLSPQDLAAYELVPELLRSGVTSLKIEGRLKSPEYVANITRHYRRALDTALAGDAPRLAEQDRRDMEMSFSRGLSVGWLRGSDHKMLVPGDSSSKRGALLGTVVRTQESRVTLRLEAPLRRGDGIAFDVTSGDRPQQGGRVYEIFCRDQPLVEARATETVDVGLAHGVLDLTQIRPGQRAWKTDDPILNKNLRRTFDGSQILRRVPVDMSISARVGQPLRVEGITPTGIVFDVSSSTPLSPARQHPVTESFLREQLGRLGHTHFQLRDLTLQQHGHPMVPLSVLGRIRKQIVEHLESFDLPRHPTIHPSVSLLTEWRSATAARPAGQALSQSTTGPPNLHVMCRNLLQLERALSENDVQRWYVDFQDIREYRPATEWARELGREVYLATPRIHKPGETGIFHALARQQPHGVLARNLAGLAFFAERGVPVVADFSLNAANELTVEQLRRWGASLVTPSYDLNRDQLFELLRYTSPESVEIVIHQHMPMFHMEHCVFCAVLSPGTNKTNCGRPCDVHEVRLRDRVGMEHPLTADVGCRNTLFNSQAQSGAEAVTRLLEVGVRNYRIELLQQDASETRMTIELYRRLLNGKVSGQQVWQELKAFNRVGVTHGTMEHERDPLSLL